MLTLNFTPFPLLSTERLFLRPPALSDENETYFMRTDEKVNRYVDRPRPASVEDARQFIQRLNERIAKNESIAWVLTLKDDPKLIGSICLWNISPEDARAEIGFELHPEQQGKGLMQEAVLKIVDYGFNVMKLKVIEGWVHEENTHSIKILEKNNFTGDFDMENKMAGKDYFKNMLIYSLYATLPGQ